MSVRRAARRPSWRWHRWRQRGVPRTPRVDRPASTRHVGGRDRSGSVGSGTSIVGIEVHSPGDRSRAHVRPLGSPQANARWCPGLRVWIAPFDAFSVPSSEPFDVSYRRYSLGGAPGVSLLWVWVSGSPAHPGGPTLRSLARGRGARRLWDPPMDRDDTADVGSGTISTCDPAVMSATDALRARALFILTAASITLTVTAATVLGLRSQGILDPDCWALHVHRRARRWVCSRGSSALSRSPPRPGGGRSSGWCRRR